MTAGKLMTPAELEAIRMFSGEGCDGPSNHGSGHYGCCDGCGYVEDLLRHADALQAEVKRLTTARRVGEESAYALAAANNDEARREAARADALQAQLDGARRDVHDAHRWLTEATLRAEAARHLLAWQQARWMRPCAAPHWHYEMEVRIDALRAENERLKEQADRVPGLLSHLAAVHRDADRVAEALDALLDDLPLPARELIDAANAALSETGGGR